MYKTLKSGLVVDTDIYYRLLDWKDQHLPEFKQYCDDIASSCNYSINNMHSLEFYNLCIKLGIK